MFRIFLATGLLLALSAGFAPAGDRDGAPTLRDYTADLASPIWEVRLQAVVALARSADRAAVPLLQSALHDRQPAVRREAAKALGMIKDGRSVAVLIESLGDNDKNVRMYAAYALGEIKDIQAADALLRAVRDTEWCVRDQAAWALRELHRPQLAEQYAALLQDDTVDVALAMWVLRGLGDAAAEQAVSRLLQAPQPAARRRAMQAIRELKGAVWKPLLEAVEDADAAVRLGAIEGLAQTMQPEIKQALLARQPRETDARVRAAIQRLLETAYPAVQAAAWWSFDDQNAQTARDVTGGGSDGEIRRCTPVPGKVGAALKLAAGSCVSLGKVPKLPMAHQPLTIMAWVKPEAERGVVVARGGAFCGYSLYLLDGVAKFGIRRQQDGPTTIAAAREPLGREWVHLAGVIKAQGIELYVNGKLAAQAKTEGLIPGNAGQGMELGGDLGNSPAEITDSLIGVIDEVKVFLSDLSAEEIGGQWESK